MEGTVLIIILICLVVVLLLGGLTGLVTIVAIRTIRELSSKSEAHNERVINAVMSGVVEGLGGVVSESMGQVTNAVEAISNAAFRPYSPPTSSEEFQPAEQLEDRILGDVRDLNDWTDGLVSFENEREEIMMVRPGEGIIGALIPDDRNMVGENFDD